MAAKLLARAEETYGTRTQKCTRKDFLGMRHSLSAQFFFKILLPDQRLYIVKNMCVCVYIYMTAQRLCLS